MRGGSIAAKFLLYLFLARFLSLEDLGVYALLASTNVIATYALGLEFRAFSSRELVNRGPGAAEWLLANQLVLHAGTYLVLTPVAVLLFRAGILPTAHGWLFGIVMLAGHLAHETAHMLVVLARPARAGLVLFVAHATWAFVFMVVAFAFPSLRRLDVVLALWAAGAVAGAAVGVASVAARAPLRALTTRPDWNWLRTGLRRSAPFMTSSVAARVTESMDRYAVGAVLGEAALGAYALYASIARVLTDLTMSGSLSFSFPLLLGAWSGGRHAEAAAVLRRMVREVLLWSGGLAVALSGVMPLVLALAARPEATRLWPIFPALLAAQVLVSLSLVSNYVLYAGHADRTLMGLQLVAMLVSAALYLALVPTFGVWGATLATLGGAFFLAAALGHRARRLWRRAWPSHT